MKITVFFLSTVLFSHLAFAAPANLKCRSFEESTVRIETEIEFVFLSVDQAEMFQRTRIWMAGPSAWTEYCSTRTPLTITQTSEGYRFEGQQFCTSGRPHEVKWEYDRAKNSLELGSGLIYDCD